MSLLLLKLGGEVAFMPCLAGSVGRSTSQVLVLMFLQRGEERQQEPKSVWAQGPSCSASLAIRSPGAVCAACQVSSEALGYRHAKEQTDVHSHGQYSKGDRYQGATLLHQLLQTVKGPWRMGL